MGLFNKNEEREVSSGAVFGYALIGFVVVVIVAFAIFVGVKKIGGSDSEETTKTQTQIETTVDTEVETN